MNWSYSTALYGQDISMMTKDEERALIGNYRTVGLLKDSIFTEITDHKMTNQYLYDNATKEMSELSTPDKSLKDLCISYYETASKRYSDGAMKEKSTD